jgi:GxxExxY protein
MNIEELGNSIIGAAIRVHRSLGPGLLESAYQKCLEYELSKMGLRVECECVLPIQYETVQIDAGYRIDMLVEKLIIIENKTVEHILPIHEAQLLTYLKLKGCAIGYLLNWNVPVLKDGIRRMVNRL